jgi:hypothetical protein
MSTLHQIALLLGVFGVPLALLLAGRRLRRASIRRQSAFWGAMIGHIVACIVALTASLIPPIGWLSTDTVRGAAGVWALLALPLLGAMLGAFTRSGTHR